MNKTISVQQSRKLLVPGAHLCPIPGYHHRGDFVPTVCGLAYRRGGTEQEKGNRKSECQTE